MNVRSGKYTRANRPRVVGVITASIMHALSSSSLHYFLITSSFVLYLFHPIAYPLLPNIFILPFFSIRLNQFTKPDCNFLIKFRILIPKPEATVILHRSSHRYIVISPLSVWYRLLCLSYWGLSKLKVDGRDGLPCTIPWHLHPRWPWWMQLCNRDLCRTTTASSPAAKERAFYVARASETLCVKHSY